MDQVCHSQGKIKGKQYQTIWKNNNFLRSGNILVCYTAVFSVVTQRCVTTLKTAV